MVKQEWDYLNSRRPEDLPAPPEVSPPTALADPEDGVPEEKVKRVKVS